MTSVINGISHEVVYGSKVIKFSLIACSRKTLEIAVHPDRAVVVKAPLRSDISLIEAKVKRRARWIIKQLNYFKQFNPRTPERCYVSGETHLYLGRQYRLKVESGSSNAVKLSRGSFQINCAHGVGYESVKKVLNAWYLEKAKIQFAESLDRCWSKFKNLGLDKPDLKIRRMEKRWGSLSASGSLILNTELIKTPKECIDYVVTHELCHLKYHDHSVDFYRLLESMLPSWEKVKQRLELSLV